MDILQVMHYEVLQDKDSIGDWRVEAINYPELGLGGDGEIYVAIFCGPKAQTRAREYAVYKEFLDASRR